MSAIPSLAVLTFLVGLLIALGAGGLLLANVIESGPAAMFGIVGIGLIGASGGLIASKNSRRGRS